MSDDEQTIHNPAPNQGAQGQFHGDVHTGPSYDQQHQGIERDQYNAGRDIIMVDTARESGGRDRRMPWNSDPATISPRLRADLLAVLDARYKRRLADSLEEQVRIALDLHTLPNAISPQWRQMHLHGPARSRDIPAGTPIAQIFDEAGGELLILGAPGAGKTTLLLELARALLALTHGYANLAQVRRRFAYLIDTWLHQLCLSWAT